jgi:hypothetical protein
MRMDNATTLSGLWLIDFVFRVRKECRSSEESIGFYVKISWAPAYPMGGKRMKWVMRHFDEEPSSRGI